MKQYTGISVYRYTGTTALCPTLVTGTPCYSYIASACGCRLDAGTRVDWYTGSPVHKYTGTSVHRCTGTHVHQYTGIPVYWHTDTPGHQYTGTPKRRHNGTLEHRGTGTLMPWYTSTLVYQYTGAPVQKHTGTPPNLTGTVSRPIQPGRSAHKIRGHGKLQIGQYPLTDRIHGGKGWNSRRIATPSFATESTWLIQTLLWPTR